MTGGHSSEIPTLVFRVVPGAQETPAVVNDKLAVTYGFNNGQPWEGTGGEGKEGQAEGRYLRWHQPMESELALQVEYDMDEQDKSWLDAVNIDRRREGQSAVTYEVFEIIMDKLEKEWFDLTKSIPKKTNAMPNEDSKCAICDDGECENSNAIVFCDGCNLAVHQDCYGVPYIPEGQWLCRKCTVSPDKPVSCVLCPNSYGAFKQTTTAQWAHLLCAIWIPDTGVSNTVYMEPIDGVENISKNRWKLVCFLCKKRVGACIQCANRNCFTAFHVTCAREYGLELKMKQGGGGGELKSYCDKHSENFAGFTTLPPSAGKRSHKKAEPFKHRPGQRLILKHGAAQSSKSARAYKKSYSFGPPLVPAFVFDRVLEYVNKVKMAKRPAFVALVCKYWSLKREARRGAPLLKRLHLEPWTASATSRQQTDVEKAKKLELTRLLRNDLEKVRMLTEQVRKREKKKLERAQVLKNLVDEFIFPNNKHFRVALGKIGAFDKQHIFAQPVSKIHVPDYYDVIKFPMDWATMGEKLDRHEYHTATDFVDDVELVINNARRYNREDSHVHKLAVKVIEQARPILAELEALDTLAVTKSSDDVAALLTSEYLEDLFKYHCEPAPPKPKTPKVKSSKSKGRVNELAESGDLKDLQRSKKRKAAAAELGEGDAVPSRATPRLRGMLAELSQLDMTPVVSKRSNAREAARLRAGVAAIAATPTESAISSSFNGKGKGKEKEVLGDGKEEVLSKRRRSASQTPGLASAPSVNVVDNRDSFKHFETGWVLPEGSSRRRKDPAPFAPPPKSALFARAKPPAGEPIESKALTEAARLRDAAEAAKSSSKSRKGKEKEALEAADGEMVEARSSNANASVSPVKGGVPSRSRLHENWRLKVRSMEGPMLVDDARKFEDGDMLWARIPGYPFYPSEYTEEGHESVTTAMMKNKPNDPDAVLVFFFDDERNAAWISRSNLRLMGEDLEYDKLLLQPWAHPKARDKKPEQEKVDQMIHDYEWAMQNMETEEDTQAATKSAKRKSSNKKRRR